jgi:DNA-binding response OmpR family regulator
MSEQPIVVHVDDERNLVDLTELALRAIPVRVVGIMEPMVGLQTVRFLRPALVLLDVMMPGLDGWELLRRIKADSDLKETRVVLYTALSGEPHESRARAGGADGFLAKPCTPAQLREMVVRQLKLDPGAAQPQPAPSARDLPATDFAALPAAVTEFVDRYLDSPVALEVLSYLRDNPQQYLGIDELARALGQRQSVVEPAVRALTEKGLVLSERDNDGDVFMLAASAALKRAMDAFFEACSDPQVRVKATYRIIRRRMQFR